MAFNINQATTELPTVESKIVQYLFFWDRTPVCRGSIINHGSRCLQGQWQKGSKVIEDDFYGCCPFREVAGGRV